MNDSTILEISTMLWRRYSVAADNLNKVKAETNDGSKDWKLFHTSRYESACGELNLSYEMYTDFRDTFDADLRRITGV